MSRPVNRSLRPSFLCAITQLLALLISAKALAVPIDFTAELLEDDGRTFYAVFWIDSSELEAQPTLIEDVNDFIAVVDGITYSWGPVLPDPPPFSALAAYETGSGALAAIETPFITALGYPSTINLRLLLDNTWTANTCYPIPTCSPDYLFGTYFIEPVIIPEPSGGGLLLVGLLLFSSRRPTSR